ncbi:hypothetical protein LCGC14_3113530, partial [marine sediment metagenome]
IGWLYGKIGAQEKAIEHLRKYCNLAPDAKNKSKAITRIVILQGILDRKNELIQKYEQRNVVMK